MALFDKRQSLSIREVKDALGKDSGIIPGTGGQRFSKDQRDRIGREVFGPKYGSNISKNDYRRAVQSLELTKLRVKDSHRREVIDQKIRYLKELGGKNL